MAVEKSRVTPAPSSGPLKDSAQWPLLSVVLGNIAVFYVAVKTGSLVMDGVVQLAHGWRELIPAGGSFVLVSVLNELLDSVTKARLVFWRWHNPLPGTGAFTKYGTSDLRVNIAILERKYGPLPTDPHAQNALWYKLYKSIANDPAVIQVHRKYLFTRDYAVGSFLLILTLGTTGYWAIPSLSTAFCYFGLLVLQYFLVRQAARNNGVRFVTTVLAIKAAE